MDRCDSLDPYYRIDLATDSSSGAVSASLVPRYVGAERGRPITLQATLTSTRRRRLNRCSGRP